MKITWILWLIWYAYWIISARNRIRSTEESEAKRESTLGRLGYTALLILGFGLLIWHLQQPLLKKQLWSLNHTWLSIGLIVQSAGLAFAVWARHTLGKNWTARITTGGSQQLVIRGPYRLVRHPIYSGLLFAVLGTAIQIDALRAVLGFLAILAGVLLKLRREEAALRQHFGSAYEDYAQKVTGVIPGVI
jgi:protein-S-isoprenylcysteine O-methyltransferase Ste14